MSTRLAHRSRPHGFTLAELILVITILGIIGATLSVFFTPAVNAYFDTRRRADLTDIADTALRRMSRDIRSAVPNSVIAHSATCLQLVPTITGGRYRMGPDIANDAPGCAPSASCSAPVDPGTTTTTFDVLSPLSVTPAQNDHVVINNQNGTDVYTGSNRAQLLAAPTTPRAGDGLYRFTLTGSPFPAGYDGGRFVVVANSEQTVVYKCVGGALYRASPAFGAAADCGGANGALVATDVAACNFVYTPNQGATQQSGFAWVQLDLSRSGETVTLAHGVHVDNVP